MAKPRKLSLRDQYFYFLRSFVWDDEYPNMRGETYEKLLNELYDFPFRFSIPMDENRAMDSYQLREEFLSSLDKPPYLDELGLVNCLEVLIEMCRRLEYMSEGTNIEQNVEGWFWTLMENATLDEYPDRYAEPGRYESIEIPIRRKLGKILDRLYSRNGKGSFFPLPGPEPTADMRRLELWDQMSTYVLVSSNLI